LLIKVQGTGESLDDADRTMLTSALRELQQLRAANANRVSGIARRTAKQQAERLEQLRLTVENHQHRRDDAMRAARNARLAFPLLEPVLLRELVGGHVYRAHCHSRAAVRVLKKVRELQEVRP
jgi:hypothetical protein